MNDLQPQLALREWRTHISHPTTLVALFGVAAILAVAGPFETGDVLRFVPRFIYWLVIVAASYSIGFLISDTFQAKRTRWHMVLLVIVTGVLTGLGVAIVVLSVNFAALGFVPPLSDLPEFIGAIIAISMIVTLVATVIGMNATAANDQTLDAAAPPLLERLPFDKRAPLIAVSVEDHYVRIHTTKGEELILLRLSDAIKEVGNTQGAQVHRSHWAAFDQVQKTRREGDRVILTMSNMIEIPVSRANVAKIKEVGLLPR